MKLKDALCNLGPEEATKVAREIACELQIDWENGICHVFKVIANDPERVPSNIGGRRDDERAVIRKWIVKYDSGKDSCASKRRSQLPGTLSDPIIEKIIGARLNHISPQELLEITYAHRLAMSAENILGLILEEYLAQKLAPFGWYCAWKETIKSVDFVHGDGRLLQIKNRSNSENSSSSAVRLGTQINKWHRINAERAEYNWGQLNGLCGTKHLSECSFVNFATETIKTNPSCLAVEPDSPWARDKGR